MTISERLATATATASSPGSAPAASALPMPISTQTADRSPLHLPQPRLSLNHLPPSQIARSNPLQDAVAAPRALLQVCQSSLPAAEAKATETARMLGAKHPCSVPPDRVACAPRGCRCRRSGRLDVVQGDDLSRVGGHLHTVVGRRVWRWRHAEAAMSLQEGSPSSLTVEDRKVKGGVL